MRNYLLFFCLGAVFFCSSAALAQDEATGQASDSDSPSLFSSLYTGTDSILEMTIETDVRGMIRQKLKEEYQKATIRIKNEKGETFEDELKIRARGNRRKEVCYYPPLKLKFKKASLTKAGLSSSNDLKLVIQCRETKTGEYYVAKEYLAYKLYNMISPYSFRAQLFKVTFVDNRGKGKTREMLGFLIEPEEELAQRINGELVERSTMRSTFLSDEPHQIMGIFEYMIGNTDWSIGNSHNLKFVKIDEYDRLTPIPYDFDYSGFVNTDYAVPFHTLGLESVTQRLYRGIECTQSEIPLRTEIFKAKEEEILEYVRNFPHLDNYTRREAAGYLEEFFEILHNERRARDAFGSR
jgi:hypothetical protein